MEIVNLIVLLLLGVMELGMLFVAVVFVCAFLCFMRDGHE